jgi:hypothetical protein
LGDGADMGWATTGGDFTAAGVAVGVADAGGVPSGIVFADAGFAASLVVAGSSLAEAAAPAGIAGGAAWAASDAGGAFFG